MEINMETASIIYYNAIEFKIEKRNVENRDF